jgi:hypothetical protein
MVHPKIIGVEDKEAGVDLILLAGSVAGGDNWNREPGAIRGLPIAPSKMRSDIIFNVRTIFFAAAFGRHVLTLASSAHLRETCWVFRIEGT